MIQRIQTLWLLMGGISTLLTLKFPFLAGQKDGIAFSLNAAGEFYLIILSVAIALSSFITLFLFKNRKLQMKLTSIGFMLSLLLNGLFFYAYNKNCYDLENVVITLSAVIYFAIPIFLLLAFLSIRKDEKLIKSLDRLR
jgi:drug/metabolite transporter (DMT)-like permease